MKWAQIYDGMLVLGHQCFLGIGIVAWFRFFILPALCFTRSEPEEFPLDPRGQREKQSSGCISLVVGTEMCAEEGTAARDS